MLDLQSLAVGYRNTRGVVLSGIDLSAAPGDFICILGRNGAGKSTLMRTIAGLQTSLAGTASLDGEDIASMRPATRARRIAVVLTERQFNPGLRVDDVIALARQPFTGWRGGLADDDSAAIADAVVVTGVEPFLRRFFSDLSDGERQRVMIARALAQTPHLMVLDEITAFLDLPSRVEIMALLRSHARRKGQIVLLSSHDLDLSLQLSDSVWLLDGAGGFSVGTPDALSRSGAVGRAFDTDLIRFAPSRGASRSGRLDPHSYLSPTKRSLRCCGGSPAVSRASRSACSGNSEAGEPPRQPVGDLRAGGSPIGGIKQWEAGLPGP